MIVTNLGYRPNLSRRYIIIRCALHKELVDTLVVKTFCKVVWVLTVLLLFITIIVVTIRTEKSCNPET
jgi:hypothetical protein